MTRALGDVSVAWRASLKYDIYPLNIFYLTGNILRKMGNRCPNGRQLVKAIARVLNQIA